MREGQIRKIKRGDVIFREGERADMAFIIQAGLVSLSIEKSANTVELMKIGKGQILGHQCLLGWGDFHTFTAIAVMPVELLELPLDMLKAQITGLNNVQRLVFKSLSEQGRMMADDQKAYRIEKDGSPCPNTSLPRLSACLHLVTRRFGGEENGEWSISWSTLRMYTLRMFFESTGRMQSFCDLLSKLGLAQVIKALNEEGEEEVSFIRLKDMALLEDFGDFYQRNLYKQGRSKIIEIDKLCLNVMRSFVVVAEGRSIDPRQGVQISLQELIESAKAKTGFQLKQEHFELLKERGLDVKKLQEKDEIRISYNPSEFMRIYKFWQIIYEVDKWNLVGRVELVDKEEKKESAMGQCSSCKGSIVEEMRFCPHCGTKVTA